MGKDRTERQHVTPPSPKRMCSFYSHKADLKMRWQGLFSGEHFQDTMKIPKHVLEALWYMSHLFGEAE